MGVPVVDESNWKRRHWPPKQLFVLSFVTAERARAPVAVSVSRRRAVNIAAAARESSLVWESCSKHSKQQTSVNVGALSNYAIYCGNALNVRALMLTHKLRTRQNAARLC